MLSATATVVRGAEAATVTVEIRPAQERKILTVDLTAPAQIHTVHKVPSGFNAACEIAACSGVRYATSLAGRDQLVAIRRLSGNNLTIDAHDAFAHAAMYASWRAVRFNYTDHEISVDHGWVLQE